MSPVLMKGDIARIIIADIEYLDNDVVTQKRANHGCSNEAKEMPLR